MLYSTYLGGTLSEYGNGIVLDNSGNVYITGQVNSYNFPATLGAYDTSTNGSYDVFIAKFNPSLSGSSSLIYATYLGGTASESGKALTVDNSGNAYITGATFSADFPVTASAYDTNQNGLDDIFVTKLNADGSSLIFSTFLGGVGSDTGNAIVLDTAGNIYLTGRTDSANFPVKATAIDTILNDGTFPYSDAFITKLDATGAMLLYSTYIGGQIAEEAVGIKLDSAGNIYIAGKTSSSDFPTTAGAFDQSFNGGGPLLCDCFVSKLDASGTAFLYSTFLGGSQDDYCGALTINTMGEAYITGYTFSSNFPVTPGAYDTTFGSGIPGPIEMYITRLNSSGSDLVFSTFFGGSSGKAIAVDIDGNVYVTGANVIGDLPITPDALDTTFNNSIYAPSYTDAFVSKLDPTGASVLYSSYLGGGSSDYGLGLALDNTNNVYLTGWTWSTDFPITTNAFDTSLSGSVDAIFCKMNIAPAISTKIEFPIWTAYK